MRSSLARVSSFAKWSETASSTVSFVRLAAAGYRYAGHADSVVCGRCETVVSGWLTAQGSSLPEHNCHTDRETQQQRDPEINGRTQSRNTQCTSNTSVRATERSCRQLEADGVTRAPDAIASCFGRQMELNVDELSTSDARDIAATDLHDEEQMLIEENRRLHDARTCKVCVVKEVNTVFLPCGHLVSCDQCAPKLRDCAVCRTYIRGTVKTFMS